MTRNWSYRIAMGLAWGASLVACVAAGEPNGASSADSRRAQELVRSALGAEISGRVDQRAERLAAALQQSPNHAPARWHAGYVRLRSGWVHVDEMPAAAPLTVARLNYARRRGIHPNTVEDQFALGTWCARQGLNEESRAHFLRVLDLEPDHEKARQRLGYQRVGKTWLKPDELQQLRTQARQLEKELAKWKPVVERLRKRWEGKNETDRLAAERELLAIDDAGAIASLEALLGERDEAAAQLLVGILGWLKDQQATMALARQAVFSSWNSVREAAARELKPRAWEAFIPYVLAVMRKPIEVTVKVQRGPDGALEVKQTFTRESETSLEVSVDTLLLPTFLAQLKPDALGGHVGAGLPAVGGADGGDVVIASAGPDLVQRAIDARIEQASRLVAQENARLALVNDHITRMLNLVTDQELAPEPGVWWMWWLKHNELVAPEKRTVLWGYRWDQVTTIIVSCFAPGTPVWTLQGARPVEQIQVGDQVLAQDSLTGELAYRPVVRTTVRAPVELVKITTETDTLHATGGHPFWVSGVGWVHARRLKAGDLLHSVNGGVRVNSVTEAAKEPTHNLVVDGFHSYFVGREKLLVHDTAPRGPTTTVVPGLSAHARSSR